MCKRASENGARFFRVHRVNKKLKEEMYWLCWRVYQESVPWCQFFVFYPIYFNAAFKRAKGSSIPEGYKEA